jgi:tRNA pseudouridine55 synthase
LLLIDKCEGFTSMDVCAILRTRLRRGGAPKRLKVGHGGTLDPMATGLLVVMVGASTRLCESVMAGEKEYEASVDLARVSSTDDREGEVRDVHPDAIPSCERVEEALRALTGEIEQRPPAFSAIKVGGRRAYDVARGGGEVALPARKVLVHEITIHSYTWPRLDIHVRCGKGVYIRSLARDLGPLLGCGGMLTGLRRTRVGGWSVSRARRLDELPDTLTQSDLLDEPR